MMKLLEEVQSRRSSLHLFPYNLVLAGLCELLFSLSYDGSSVRYGNFNVPAWTRIVGLMPR